MSAESAKQLPIAVIIPAFNAALTLPRAIASVAAQTYLPSEVIIIDDGSADETPEVVTKSRVQHSKISIRSVRLEKNQGVASARNVGLDLAKMEFIAFLDADDAWHPRKLEIQHRWLEEHPDIPICAHSCIVHDKKLPLPEILPGPVRARKYGLSSFLLANRISTPTVMLRREVTERFADGKRYSEDYLLWMQIIAARGPLAFIDLPLAFLFKPRYGSSGLSGDLESMRAGEADTFRRLREQQIIGPGTWLLVSAWSWVKYLKRLVSHHLTSLRHG